MNSTVQEHASSSDINSPSANINISEALSKFDKNAIRSYIKGSKTPDLGHIPGDKGLPLFGHSLWISFRIHKWLQKQFEKYGPVFRFRVLNKEALFLLGPEANKLILQNEDKIFSNFLAYGPNIKNLLDDNVLSLDFAHLKDTRKTLQSAFKRNAVEGHIDLMNPMLQEGIAKWPVDREVKTTDNVRKLLLDTGAKVFLGLDMGAEANTMNQAFVHLVGAGNAVLRFESLSFMPYAKALKARRTMNDFVYANIKKRREASEAGRDIFSQLCNAKDDDGNYFSNAEIANQIIFVLFAAHDTTSSALSSTFYHLASNPDWQEELRQEMFDLGKENLEFEDFDKLVKTGWTMQEALRMYPPAPILPRFALKEFEFNGYKIPANTPCIGFSPFTHYMEEFWSDPYKFDPLRFSPERAEDKKEFWQYVPFGGGAHKCLGLHFAQVQGKMFMYYFLKNYRITKNPKMKEFKYNNFPLTFPTDGLPLTFTKINQN